MSPLMPADPTLTQREANVAEGGGEVTGQAAFNNWPAVGICDASLFDDKGGRRIEEWTSGKRFLDRGQITDVVRMEGGGSAAGVVRGKT